MAMSWNQAEERPSGMIADRTLCFDKTDKLVLEGSVESAYQLVNAGREIPSDEVARLGLVIVDGRVAQASKEEAPALESAPEVDPESHGESEG